MCVMAWLRNLFGGGKDSSAFTLDSLAEALSSGTYRNVVILCGAGISTSAGVPDFRSPSAGLYFKLRKYDLPYPEAIFEGSYFKKNPLPFYELVREIFPKRLCPTTTHKFFGLLHQKGFLRRIYTQNIDALEFLAGVPEEKVVEVHGTFQRSHCVDCGKVYDLAWLKENIFAPERNEGVPKCTEEKCARKKAVVRPDVVFFGEPLPERYFPMSEADMAECDLLLVFGTSLAVAPVNGLVAKAKNNVPRVYINRTKPGQVGFVGWLMGLSKSIRFEGANDLVVRADCDDTVEDICDKAGWRQDLDNVPIQILEP